MVTISDPTVFTSLHIASAQAAYVRDLAEGGGADRGGKLSPATDLQRYFASSNAKFSEKQLRIDGMLDQSQRSQSLALLTSLVVDLKLRAGSEAVLPTANAAVADDPNAPVTPGTADAAALAAALASTSTDSPFDRLERARSFYTSYVLTLLRLYGTDSRAHAPQSLNPIGVLLADGQDVPPPKVPPTTQQAARASALDAVATARLLSDAVELRLATFNDEGSDAIPRAPVVVPSRNDDRSLQVLSNALPLLNGLVSILYGPSVPIGFDRETIACLAKLQPVVREILQTRRDVVKKKAELDEKKKTIAAATKLQTEAAATAKDAADALTLAKTRQAAATDPKVQTEIDLVVEARKKAAAEAASKQAEAQKGVAEANKAVAQASLETETLLSRIKLLEAQVANIIWARPTELALMVEPKNGEQAVTPRRLILLMVQSHVEPGNKPNQVARLRFTVSDVCARDRSKTSVADVRVLFVHPGRTYDLEDNTSLEAATNAFSAAIAAQLGGSAGGEIAVDARKREEERRKYLSRINRMASFASPQSGNRGPSFGWYYYPSNVVNDNGSPRGYIESGARDGAVWLLLPSNVTSLELAMSTSTSDLNTGVFSETDANCTHLSVPIPAYVAAEHGVPLGGPSFNVRASPGAMWIGGGGPGTTVLREQFPK